MNFKEALKLILTMVLPYLEEFIRSKVIPKAIRLSYEKYDKYTNNKINSVVNLVDKYISEPDKAKREAHLFGINLAVKFFRANAQKLLEACDLIEKELKNADVA